MAHLNGYSLKRWNKGDGLGASDLNGNFATIAEMAERAMLEARLPDQAVVALEMSIRSLKERIANLEALTSMHARQRNEKEWAPLSYLGALVTLVNEANLRFEGACRRIDEMHTRLGVEHDDLDRRLRRTEQQPEAATQEDFSVLVGDVNRLALKEHMLLAQTIALRAEVSMLREMAMGHARQRNEIEYTPLATTAHLLERIMKLEAR
jgi:hypothetical protein